MYRECKYPPLLVCGLFALPSPSKHVWNLTRIHTLTEDDKAVLQVSVSDP